MLNTTAIQQRHGLCCVSDIPAGKLSEYIFATLKYPNFDIKKYNWFFNDIYAEMYIQRIIQSTPTMFSIRSRTIDAVITIGKRSAKHVQYWLHALGLIHASKYGFLATGLAHTLR
jgi:hypothetical protein